MNNIKSIRKDWDLIESLIKEKSRILDIGCGDGTLMEYLKNQKSIDANNNTVILKAKGRHDPCVVPRAVPIVESMAANVLVDLYLLSKK